MDDLESNYDWINSDQITSIYWINDEFENEDVDLEMIIRSQ